MNLLREPPPKAVQQEGSTLSVVCQAASTDLSLEIEWYQTTIEGQKFPVENSPSTVQGLLFKIESAVLLKTNILTTVTSTLTMEHLSVAYVGAYTCRAMAGELTVDSDALCKSQVQLHHRLASFNQCTHMYTWYGAYPPFHTSGTTMSSTLLTTGGCVTGCLDQDWCCNWKLL